MKAIASILSVGLICLSLSGCIAAAAAAGAGAAGALYVDKNYSIDISKKKKNSAPSAKPATQSTNKR